MIFLGLFDSVLRAIFLKVLVEWLANLFHAPKRLANMHAMMEEQKELIRLLKADIRYLRGIEDPTMHEKSGWS